MCRGQSFFLCFPSYFSYRRLFSTIQFSEDFILLPNQPLYVRNAGLMNNVALFFPCDLFGVVPAGL